MPRSSWFSVHAVKTSYMVLKSRLRHRYQQATLRYGSQRLAIFSICSGVGSLIFRLLAFLAAAGFFSAEDFFGAFARCASR